MLENILTALLETMREYSLERVTQGRRKGKTQNAEKDERPKVIGRFIKVESIKPPAGLIAVFAGLFMMAPAMFCDAYLVHRFPKYFPHYLDFTFIFMAVYFAVLLLWMHFGGVTKSTTEDRLVQVVLWLYVLAMAAMPWYISWSAVLPECVQNLWVIQTAKVDWMVANHKKEYDTPTWEDVKPYLQKRGWKNGIPVCPDGGKYTLGKVGERPTCSIGDSDHWLPSIAEPPQARVRY